MEFMMIKTVIFCGVMSSNTRLMLSYKLNTLQILTYFQYFFTSTLRSTCNKVTVEGPITTNILLHNL